MKKEDMGEITRLAYRAIEEDDQLMAKLSSPEEVLAFVKNQDNFKSLSQLLIETMINAGIGDTELSIDFFINELYTLLIERDYNAGTKPESIKKTIRRWFNGEVNRINAREDVIAICFALGLNKEMSTNLLNKCGFSGFNVRRADDATYLYCIYNKRSLKDAKSILEKYESAETNIPSSTLILDENTLTLEHALFEGMNWEDDDSFLNSFLIPKKPLFFGYATTAVCEYYFLKNHIFIALIKRLVREEISQSYSGDATDEIALKRNSLVSSFNTELDKVKDPSHLLYSIKEYMYNRGSINTALEKIEAISEKNRDINSQRTLSSFIAEIMSTEMFYRHTISTIINRGKKTDPLFTEIITREHTKAYTDKNLNNRITLSEIAEIKQLEMPEKPSSLRDKRAFAILSLLADGVPEEVLIKLNIKDYHENEDSPFLAPAEYNAKRYLLSLKTGRAIHDYLLAKGVGRIRPRRDSSLKETVLNEFPDDKTLAKFEKDYSLLSATQSIRKAIILMYFIAYAYELSIYLESDDFNYKSSIFGSMGFYEFVGDDTQPGLDALLTRCRLWPLYPANQFDWLILKSVKELEEYDSDEDENPITFFNKVIALSFGDDLFEGDEDLNA